MPLEFRCDACGVRLQAESESALVDLGLQHALSIHGHPSSRDDVLARVRQQNR